jgi:hypothetical protein
MVLVYIYVFLPRRPSQFRDQLRFDSSTVGDEVHLHLLNGAVLYRVSPMNKPPPPPVFGKEWKLNQLE